MNEEHKSTLFWTIDGYEYSWIMQQLRLRSDANT